MYTREGLKYWEGAIVHVSVQLKQKWQIYTPRHHSILLHGRTNFHQGMLVTKRVDLLPAPQSRVLPGTTQALARETEKEESVLEKQYH